MDAARAFLEQAQHDPTITKIYTGPTTHHERLLIALVLSGVASTILIFSFRTGAHPVVIVAGLMIVWSLAIRWIQRFVPRIAVAWNQEHLCFKDEFGVPVLLSWDAVKAVDFSSKTNLVIRTQSSDWPYLVVIRSSSTTSDRVFVQLQMALEGSRSGVQSPYPRA